MPRLNSVMLCPKARASEGSRLEPNNSNTIARINKIFQVNRISHNGEAIPDKYRQAIDLPSILQGGRPQSNGAKAPGGESAADLSFQGQNRRAKIDV